MAFIDLGVGYDNIQFSKARGPPAAAPQLPTSSSRFKKAANSRQTTVAISGLWWTTRTPSAKALAEAGVEVLPGPFLDFRDPWGNRFEIEPLASRGAAPCWPSFFVGVGRWRAAI
jgi:hypothetical protein